MTRRRANAPDHALLPGEASTTLKAVTYIFASGGILSLLLLAVGLTGKLIGWKFLADAEVDPLAVIVRVVISAGYLWTAWLLSQRRELGGFLGLGFLGLSIVPRLLAGGSLLSTQLLIPVFGAIGLMLSWSYLDDGAVRNMDGRRDDQRA